MGMNVSNSSPTFHFYFIIYFFVNLNKYTTLTVRLTAYDCHYLQFSLQELKQFGTIL